jgi:hypothetical protein
MANGKSVDGCDVDALERMVRNVELFLTGAQTQLVQLKKALKNPQMIEKRREKIKASFMDKINSALETLQSLEGDTSEDKD